MTITEVTVHVGDFIIIITNVNYKRFFYRIESLVFCLFGSKSIYNPFLKMYVFLSFLAKRSCNLFNDDKGIFSKSCFGSNNKSHMTSMQSLISFSLLIRYSVLELTIQSLLILIFLSNFIKC